MKNSLPERTDSCENASATSCSSLRPEEFEANFPKFGKLSRSGVIGCHCPSQGVHGCYLIVSTLGPSTEANQGSGHDCRNHPGQHGGAGPEAWSVPYPVIMMPWKVYWALGSVQGKEPKDLTARQEEGLSLEQQPGRRLSFSAQR